MSIEMGIVTSPGFVRATNGAANFLKDMYQARLDEQIHRQNFETANADLARDNQTLINKLSDLEVKYRNACSSNEEQAVFLKEKDKTIYFLKSDAQCDATDILRAKAMDAGLKAVSDYVANNISEHRDTMFTGTPEQRLVAAEYIVNVNLILDAKSTSHALRRAKDGDFTFRDYLINCAAAQYLRNVAKWDDATMESEFYVIPRAVKDWRSLETVPFEYEEYQTFSLVDVRKGLKG